MCLNSSSLCLAPTQGCSSIANYGSRKLIIKLFCVQYVSEHKETIGKKTNAAVQGEKENLKQKDKKTK